MNSSSSSGMADPIWILTSSAVPVADPQVVLALDVVADRLVELVPPTRSDRAVTIRSAR
jgi:hypothetical protein